MIALPMALLTGVALALTVLASCLRLVHRRARGELAGDAGFALRLLLQPALAALLFLGLFPPRATLPERPLVVFAEGATDLPDDPAALRVALPEAPSDIAAERVPDLATALRRHPQATALRVRGDGLSARDIAATRGRALTLEQGAPISGLVALHAPSRAAAGTLFTLRGRVAGLPDARVDLLDPSGERVAHTRTDADGRFTLSASARTAGLAHFALRLFDAADAERERLPLPIHADAPAPPRILVLGGAPNAELKYLRRWASDSGATLRSRIGTGAGLVLGDAPSSRLDATALRAFDLVLLDARSLGALDNAAFTALGEALGEGIGILVRIDAPLPARAIARLGEWGMAIEGRAEPAAVHLTAHDDESAAALPVLSRLQIHTRGEDAAVLLRDSRDAALGHWRAHGRGRLGVVTLIDSYRLVLTGHRERHGALWADAFATLTRAGDTAARADIPQPLWPGERVALCGLSDGAQVIDPAGEAVPLPIDPATGAQRCAAFWPAREGWHRLLDGGSGIPFAVLPAEAGLAWRAGRRREAIEAQIALRTPAFSDVTHVPPAPRGSPWPWLAGWLALAALAWRMERREVRPEPSPGR